MPTNPFDEAAEAKDKLQPQSAPDNPFDRAAEERARFASTQLDAVNDTTPDQASEFRDMASVTGLPYGFVAKNGEAVGFAIKERRVRAYLENAPVLSRFVSKPENAALSQDSLENLARIEAAIGAKQTKRSLLDSAGRHVGAFFGEGERLIGTGVRGLGEGLDIAGKRVGQPINDGIAFATGIDLVQAELDARESNETLNSILEAGTPSNLLRSYGSEIIEAAGTLSPDDPGLSEKVAGGVGQIGGALLATYLGGPAASGALFYGAGADQQAQNLRAQGIDPADRPDAVLAGAAVTGLSEQLRLGSILRAIPKEAREAVVKKAFARIAGQAGEEAFQEAVEGLLQNAISTTYDPDQEVLEGVGEQATIAGLSAATFQALVEVALPGKQRQIKAEKAAETFTALREAIEETPLFQRDQAALKEFLDDATEGQTILLDGEGLNTLYQSEPAAFQEIADTLGFSEEQAVDAFNGGDVEVEVSKLLAYKERAGFDQLLDIARTSSDAITLAELRAQEADRLLEVDYGEALQRFQEEDAALEGFERAQRSVTEQLVAAGRSQEEAKAAGTLFGSFFRVLQDAGLDENAVFERLGIRIEGPNTPARIPDVMLEDGTVYTNDDIVALREQAGVTIPNKPQALGAFVRSIGLDPSSVFEGEVGEIDTTGLINRPGGQDLDVMAQRAADEGFISLDENGKADVTEFIDRLREDYSSYQTGGDRVYRAGDSDAVAALSAQQEARDLLGEIEGKIAEQNKARGTESLNQLVGEHSQDPIVQERLAEAKDLEVQGFDRDVIWQRTLAYRGVDGKWRAEIDDSGVELSDAAVAARADGQEISGDELLDGSGIAASYPDLLEGISVLVEFATDKSRGRYNAKSNELDLETKTDEDARSLALHELQHAIQVIEGFAYGGSATHKTPFIAAREKQALVKKTTALANRALQGLKGRTEERQELITQLDSEVRDLQDEVQRASGLTPYEFYKRLAGEVEAYNVQARQDMSIEERRETPPWATQEFDDAEQFIRVLGREVTEERTQKQQDAAREKVQERVEIEASMLAAAAKCAGGGGVGQMVAGNLAGLSIGGTGAAIFAYSAGADERKLEAIRFHQQNLSSADLREERTKSAKLEAHVAEADAEEADALNRYERALEAHYADINNMPDDPRFDVNGWAEKRTGIDAAYLDALVGHEAGDDWDAQAVTSSAQGGAQFISSTWRTWLSKYGSKYGEHPDPYSDDASEKDAALALRNDRRWGTMIAAEFTRENVLFLQNELDRPVTGKEAYLAHFLGRDQALKMLKADPSSDAAAGFPREADSNRPVFYKGCRSFECDIDGLTPRTVKEVIAKQGRAFPGQTIFPYAEPIT